AIPLATALLYLGLVGIGLAMVAPALAVPLCAVAKVLLQVMLVAIGVFANLPGATVDRVYMGPVFVVVWYAVALALFGGLRMTSARRVYASLDRRWLGTGAVAAAGVVFLVVVVTRLEPERLRVEVLDVGAAQCLLVRTPAGAVMVDAGAEPAGGEVPLAVQRRVMTYLALRGVSRLEALIITHPHEDHTNLALEVLRQIPTERLLLGPESGAEESWLALRQEANLQQRQVVPLQAGLRLPLGRASIEVLEPTGVLTGTEEDTNNNSAVLRVTYGQTRVLLPADLQLEGERRLLDDHWSRPDDLRAEVLVAAHHGSVHSNHAAFLEAVRPGCVVISCGKGARGPRLAALRRFADRGLPVWRTDLNGTLQIVSDGRKVWVKGYRNE
ncbi:MAG: MBL fold metallo-hydrolase, partial [Armatimonadia bacterium]